MFGYMRIALIGSGLVCAQFAEDSQPASSNVRGAQYPRVHADLRVTFRLKAPEARKVQLHPAGDGLGKRDLDMVKSEDGFWTVTTPPAVPGFHYYWFLVDGAIVNDPGSETYFGWARQTSGVEIPEKDVDFYLPKDVPHGDLRARWYFSKITKSWRRAYVYTPPDYDRSTRVRYPVLYLQQGAGEDERGWSTQGYANFILDNLLAERKAKPMIVVMDCGYASKPGAATQSNAFEEVVMEDLIPAIDAGYRTLSDRNHRAIAGLSMGAGQALQIGLLHLDKFSYIGAFSGGHRNFDVKTSYNGVFTDATAFHKKVRLLWIGAGTEEPQHKAALTVRQALNEAGIKSVFYESQGTAHEWQTWRRHLYEFVPALFKN